MSKITVLKSVVTTADKGYKIVELAYKTEEDKTKGMKIFDIGENKPLFAVAANTKPGDVLDASFTKNQKGFWVFSSLKTTGETGSVAKDASGDKVAPRSGTWETGDERAARQALISKQAVLNTS